MKNPISWLLEESEEDIKRDIAEAKEILKEREKALAELKNKNKKSKKPRKSKKSKNYNYLIPIAAILLIILGTIIFYYTYFPKSSNIQENKEVERITQEPFEYVCNEKNPCEDCGVVASCVQFEEILSENNESIDYVHFEIENRKNIKGNCSAEIDIIQEDEIILSKTLALGNLNPMESKRYKVSTSLPEGESHVVVNPSCEW